MFHFYFGAAEKISSTDWQPNPDSFNLKHTWLRRVFLMSKISSNGSTAPSSVVPIILITLITGIWFSNLSCRVSFSSGNKEIRQSCKEMTESNAPQLSRALINHVKIQLVGNAQVSVVIFLDVFARFKGYSKYDTTAKFHGKGGLDVIVITSVSLYPRRQNFGRSLDGAIITEK